MNIGIIGSGGREHSICVSLKKSKKLAEKLTSKAINALKPFKSKGRRLEEFAHYLLDREY